MQVSDLFVYPVKSARGIAIPAAAIDAFGLIGDRRAMFVDPSGHFITQRERPDLARIEIQPGPSSMRFLMDGKADIVVQPPHPQNRMDVAVWKQIVSAAVADEAANRELSQWLGRDVKLVFFDASARRIASVEWTGDETPVTFTDGYQILVTTTASLEALNRDMEQHGEPSVGMDRFRPNIVIDGADGWAEDQWASIEIGGIRLDLVKPCARCIMTTQDQKTGSREIANPMAAMRRIRMSADRRVPGPLFGWNAVPRSGGTVKIGDSVNIITERPEGWAFKRRA